MMRLHMTDSLARTRSKARSLKWPSRPAKVKRVAGVVVDQHVSCPQCGDMMHLSGGNTFLCNRCGWKVAVEDAIKVADAPVAGGEETVSRQPN